MMPATRRILAFVGLALTSATVALGLPARAAADSVETTTSVAVRRGPLALRGVPGDRFFAPQLLCTDAGAAASLPPIKIVDATGSGRGWRLAIAAVDSREAWATVAVVAYNGPGSLSPRSLDDPQLGERAQTVAYARSDHGMGTTVLSITVHAQPGLRVRLSLVAG